MHHGVCCEILLAPDVNSDAQRSTCSQQSKSSTCSALVHLRVPGTVAHLLCVHTLTRRFAVYTILEELSRACRAVTCVPQQTQVWISRTVYHYLDPAGSTCFGHHMSMCGICQIGQQQSHHPSGPLKAMHALPWSIFMTTVPTAAGMHLFVRLQQIHSNKR
jgi:hypothetical protein